MVTSLSVKFSSSNIFHYQTIYTPWEEKLSSKIKIEKVLSKLPFTWYKTLNNYQVQGIYRVSIIALEQAVALLRTRATSRAIWTRMTWTWSRRWDTVLWYALIRKCSLWWRHLLDNKSHQDTGYNDPDQGLSGNNH